MHDYICQGQCSCRPVSSEPNDTTQPRGLIYFSRSMEVCFVEVANSRKKMFTVNNILFEIFLSQMSFNFRNPVLLLLSLAAIVGGNPKFDDGG